MKHYFRIGPPQRRMSVDVESRIIYDVVAIQLGDIKDYRPWTIGEEFIDDLVALAASQPKGVMSNFGHNYDNLGKRLGRATNWRREGKQVKYDLSLFASADLSPGVENLASYVIAAAQEDDQILMSSISFDIDHFYQIDSGGQKLKVWYYDEDFNWVRETPALGKVYPKLSALHSVDIVGEGAATDALFSQDEKYIMLARLMADPDMPHILEQHYKEWPVLNNLFARNQEQRGFFTKLRSLLHSAAGLSAGEHPDDEPIISPDEVMEDAVTNPESMENPITQDTVDQLLATIDDLKTQITSLSAEKDQISQDYQALSTKIEDIDARLAAIAAEPADVHSSGADDPGVHTEKLYHQNPIYKQALKMRAK